MMPWRKAALRTGSNRTVCVLPMVGGSAAWRRDGTGGEPAAPLGTDGSVSSVVSGFRASGRSALRRRPDGRPAGPVLGDVGLAVLRRHRVEEDVGALEGDALHLVERPHLLRIEVQVRLRDERVPVVADEPRLLHDIRDVLAVVERLPLALAGETAHRRRRATLVLGAERDLVGPMARLRAVRADLAVDLVDHQVLTDQRRDHARPAAARVLVLGAGLEA